jgi:hypothetical protein
MAVCLAWLTSCEATVVKPPFPRLPWFMTPSGQSGRKDLNLRPRVPETRALPDCATPRKMPSRKRHPLSDGSLDARRQCRTDLDSGEVLVPIRTNDLCQFHSGPRCVLNNQIHLVPPMIVTTFNNRGPENRTLTRGTQDPRAAITLDPVSARRSPVAPRPLPCYGRFTASPSSYHIGMAGFEPATARPPDESATRLRYTPLLKYPFRDSNPDDRSHWHLKPARLPNYAKGACSRVPLFRRVTHNLPCVKIYCIYCRPTPGEILALIGMRLVGLEPTRP